MRCILIFLLSLHSHSLFSQSARSPCKTDPLYRQFDFWIGDWEVFAPNGKKTGDSKIEMILDSCIILENWKSVAGVYTGKSFNTYNAVTRQWQQTWVDNFGGTTEYLEGKYENNKMTFLTKPFDFAKDTIAVRKLTFYNISPERVRQHAEITKDNGVSWKTEYDLEYRRKR
jgi:hypothetical protein